MDKYLVVREVGKGAYGTAYIVQHKATGGRAVLKKVRLARQSLKERLGSLLEMQVLRSLCHRNILGFHEAWVEAGCVGCMVVDLAESGDLATQLRLRQARNSFFPEAHLHEMLVQLASAVAYCHRSRVVHRDIKTSNLLITAEGCLKLADFGLSCVLEEGATMSTSTAVVGTVGYMAPQLMAASSSSSGGSTQYDSYKNDIWALGCVLYEATALKPPFQGAFNMAGLAKKVSEGPLPPLPAEYSAEWKAVIKAMLSKDEAQRPTAQELLELPWLQEAQVRVADRFGPELVEGASHTVSLQQLPGPLHTLYEQFQVQLAEAEHKQRQDSARRKALQAKYAPGGLLHHSHSATFTARPMPRPSSAASSTSLLSAAAAGRLASTQPATAADRSSAPKTLTSACKGAGARASASGRLTGGKAVGAEGERTSLSKAGVHVSRVGSSRSLASPRSAGTEGGERSSAPKAAAGVARVGSTRILAGARQAAGKA